MKHQITENSIYWVDGVSEKDQESVDILNFDGRRYTTRLLSAWCDVLRLLAIYDEYAESSHLMESPLWLTVRNHNYYVTTTAYTVKVWLGGLQNIRCYEVGRDYPFVGLSALLSNMHSIVLVIDDEYEQSELRHTVGEMLDWFCTHGCWG